MKNDLKMKFEKKKEKKEIYTGSFSAQAAQLASRAGPPSPSPFSFSTETLTAGAHLSASPLPLPFFFLPLFPPEPAPPRDSRRARPPPHLPFFSLRSFKAINLPVIN
jgi:hypothetical protein